MPPIEYFRVDRSRRTRRLLTFGAVFIVMGTAGIATNFVHRIPHEIASVTTFGGAIFLLFGLVTSFSSMALLLIENHYVAVEKAGLVLHRNESEERVPWTAIEEIAHDGELLLVRLGSGGEIRWFMGGDVKKLAAHLEQQRSKALLGFLK
jgi:hypothetical protein